MTAKRPTGLILSPYHAQSHAIWAEQITRLLVGVDWSVVTMRPRFFSWRVRGNPLALAFEEPFKQALDNIDLLLATSMTDLATLRGLIPALSRVPSIVYFHENQFAYPHSERVNDSHTLEAKMVSLYAALSADAVIFNSRFNHDTYLKGAREMLVGFPDHAPADCVDLIAQKSSVIPVPLPAEVTDAKRARQQLASDERHTLNVAWNHRWEYDKGPDRLRKIIELTAQRDIPCRFFIFGQRFRKVPDSFVGLAESFPERVAHNEFVAENRAYHRLLAACNVVLSTALHDFQGLAILEGMALGCLPLVPDRLAYPEYVAREFRYRSTPDNLLAECEQVVSRLENYQRQLSKGHLPRAKLPPEFADSQLVSAYVEVINRLLAHGGMTVAGDNI